MVYRTEDLWVGDIDLDRLEAVSSANAEYFPKRKLVGCLLYDLPGIHAYTLRNHAKDVPYLPTIVRPRVTRMTRVVGSYIL